MPTRWGVTYNPRRKKPSVPRAQVGLGSGIRAPSPKPSGSPLTAGGLTQPPSLTYDPAIEAQRRAAQRGLGDTTADVKAQRHFTHTDLNEALRTINVNSNRKRADLTREAERGVRKLGTQEQDVRTQAGRSQADLRTKGERAQADFHTQLSSIARKFGELGQRQGEAANAAGVNDTGTQAASSAARQRNQGYAEAPVHTAQKRTEEDISQAQGRNEEDLASALSRIGSGRQELGSDAVTALKRLAEDQEFNQGRTKQEAGRSLFELKRKLERARREGAISNVDLLTSEIYQARANHPGAFGKTGQKKGKK